MGTAAMNEDARAAAKAVFLAERGQISGPALVDALVAQGFKQFTSATIVMWRKQYRWDECLAPVESSPLARAARGSELARLVSEQGGELNMLDGVYREMILASAALTEKMLAWANRLDAATLKADDALSIMKNVPPLIDRAIKLRDTLKDLHWRGAAHVLTTPAGDAKPLDGEILPPDGQKGHDERTDRTERTAEPEQKSVQPALSDALSAISKARQAAPLLKKDIAPKARVSIR